MSSKPTVGSLTPKYRPQVRFKSPPSSFWSGLRASLDLRLPFQSRQLAHDGQSSGGRRRSSRYIVVLKEGQFDSGYGAIERAGGAVTHTNKLGIVTVTASSSDFIETMRASGPVLAVAHNAGFKQAGLASVLDEYRRVWRSRRRRKMGRALRCTASPVGTGPEPLSACQWDMRAIGATTAGSYAVNQGRGRARSATSTRASTSPTATSCRTSTWPRRARSSTRHTHVTAGGAGDGRRLLEQGGAAGLRRPRHPHGRDDRLADQRQGRLGRRPRGDVGRPQGRHRSRATSSPTRSSTRSCTPVTSSSTR